MRFDVSVEDRETGQAWPTLVYGGITYVVAGPGKDFVVSVKPVAFAPLRHDHSYQAFLEVDGKKPGCSMLLNATNSCTFDGWVTTEGVRAFQTAKPAETEHVAAMLQPLGEQVVGTIDVKVYLSRKGGPMKVNKSLLASVDPSALDKLPDGKKFFAAPSLAAQAGSLQGKVKFGSHSYNKVSGVLSHVRLRYETASTLLLRGVLKLTDPQHKSWVDQEMADGAAASEVECEPRAEDEAAQAARRVKRERQRSAAASSSGEVVDLVGSVQPRPAPPPIDPDQVLECDLTGEGGTPAWATHKRKREVANLAGGDRNSC